MPKEPRGAKRPAPNGAMDIPTAIERAFQLAASGRCENVAEIKQSLIAEGFSIAQIEGPSLSTQLKALITKARTDAKRT